MPTDNPPFEVLGSDKYKGGRVTLSDHHAASVANMTTICITGPRANKMAAAILHIDKLQAELDRTKADYLALLTAQSAQPIYTHES